VIRQITINYGMSKEQLREIQKVKLFWEFSHILWSHCGQF